MSEHLHIHDQNDEFQSPDLANETVNANHNKPTTNDDSNSFEEAVLFGNTRKDLNKYLETRVTEEPDGKHRDPRTGKYVNSNVFYDARRQEHEEASKPKAYEAMSMSELARLQVRAEHANDKTTSMNIGEVLGAKVQAAEGMNSERDTEEHNALRRENLRKRIGLIRDLERLELKKEVASSSSPSPSNMTMPPQPTKSGLSEAEKGPDIDDSGMSTEKSSATAQEISELNTLIEMWREAKLKDNNEQAETILHEVFKQLDSDKFKTVAARELASAVAAHGSSSEVKTSDNQKTKERKFLSRARNLGSTAMQNAVVGWKAARAEHRQLRSRLSDGERKSDESQSSEQLPLELDKQPTADVEVKPKTMKKGSVKKVLEWFGIPRPDQKVTEPETPAEKPKKNVAVRRDIRTKRGQRINYTGRF